VERAAGIVAAFLQRRRGETEPTGDDETWTCPSCGERIDGQFTSCWNCSAARPVTDSGDD
jgi:hypothetical protein